MRLAPPLFVLHPGEMTECLRDLKTFQSVTIEHDTIAFPNGYDICPDVLRLYCERGCVLSQEETDRAFEPYFGNVSRVVSVVAESPSICRAPETT